MKTKVIPEAQKQKAVHSDKKTKPDASGDSKDKPNTENVFRRYDAVKKILKKWNEAISEHRLSDLENLYADEVSYYSKKSNKQAVLTQKSDWLKIHPSYKQELGYVDVYYDDEDVLGVEFVVQFTKICIENGKKTEIESYLYFRKFGNEWKIVRETDAPTEVNVARKKPVTNLPEGNYNYYTGQWSDTRDVQGFGHDQVPYSVNLNFTIGVGGITGVYHYYSGTARSRTFYLIKSGKIDNGILELHVIYSQVDDPEPEDFDEDAETETWRFKILENKQLFSLSKDEAFYSRALRPIK
ncbi:hypothetical protein [Fluviicola chungangensis]|uniref:hypothetical protein n=1 Tax=Fluviicola chungangensis TaxID=2597671 RepID=UPI0016425178|nr:hypothetical protein [Fluviicola chungangensis]